MEFSNPFVEREWQEQQEINPWNTELRPSDYIGKQVELPVFFDEWMLGARIGLITSFKSGATASQDYLRFKHPSFKRRVKIYRNSWKYLKVL